MIATKAKVTGETSQWYTSEQDGGISYYCQRYTTNRDGYEAKASLTIDRVIFDRFNSEAGVREKVSIHWTEAFRWADFDPCGGLGLSGVLLSDGRECFASGLYFSGGDGGLAEVVVGAYGSTWMKRAKKVERDEHGFAKRG